MMFLREEDAKFKHIAMVAISNLKKGEWSNPIYLSIYLSIIVQLDSHHLSSHSVLLGERKRLDNLKNYSSSSFPLCCHSALQIRSSQRSWATVRSRVSSWKCWGKADITFKRSDGTNGRGGSHPWNVWIFYNLVIFVCLLHIFHVCNQKIGELWHRTNFN